MTLYSRGSVRRSLIDTVTLRAVAQISTVVGYVVLVRGMTEEDFGVLSLLYAFIPVSALVASLGLEAVLRRYQPEYLQSGNSAAAAWLVRIVAYGRFLTNVVVLGAVLIGWNYIAPIFKLTPDHRSAFAIFSFSFSCISRCRSYSWRSGRTCCTATASARPRSCRSSSSSRTACCS